MIEIDVRKKLIAGTGSTSLHIQMQVERGEVAALFGKSGAGKTTLLRVLAGLTTPDEGVVRVEGEVWYDSTQRINLPPQRRRTGFVFQDHALFPNLSVRENLCYALTKDHPSGFIDELLEITGLGPLQLRRPDTLSGGQRQRVALARALARRPAVLLLDEPLSALDTEMRNHLQDEIRRLHNALGVTTLLVSHDLPEVFKLADRVFLLEGGLITRSGSPTEVFSDLRGNDKMLLPAEVVGTRNDGVVHTITLLVGNQIFNIISADEGRGLCIGDHVMMSPKTFSPMLLTIS